MDRETLRFFLTSGPTRKFDLRAITAQAPSDTPGEGKRLFHSRSLNQAIFFKHLRLDDNGPINTDGKLIRTLIYTPFDLEAPEDGGRSFDYTQRSFMQLLRSEDQGMSIAQDPQALRRDLEILNVFMEAPTFNPFLLHDAFERAGYDLAPEFFNVDPYYAELVKARIKNRIRPLVIAALEEKNVALSKSLETFTNRIWDARDVTRILPLVKALQLPPEEAGEILHAWCGITYFEQEFANLQDDLRDFADWLRHQRRPREMLTGDAAAYFDKASELARARYSDSWKSAVSILQSYQTTFEAFVGPERRTGPFLAFMRNARDYFWSLGGALGKLEQSVYAWRTFERGYEGARLPYERLSAFYQLINQTH